MRKLFIVALVCIVSLFCMSCATGKSDAADSAGMKYSYDVLKEGIQEKSGVFIPYNEDGAALAKKNGEMRVYFLSGEKQVVTPGSEYAERWGDGCVIFFPNGEVMLVDSGVSGFSASLVQALRSLNVSTIDYYVQSHLHNDHYSGLPALIESFTIRKMYWNGCAATLGAYNKFMNWVSAANAECQVLQRGDSLDIGTVHIDILNPGPSVIGNYELGGADEVLNNTSLAMVFTYGDFRLMMSGDMYVAAESEVLEAYKDNLDILSDITLLKTNHHGRTTSNSKAWAEATTPVIAVTTRGEGCDTGVYQNYARYGAHVFGDFTDGYVRVVSDGRKYTNTTCSRQRPSLQAYTSLDTIAKTVRPDLWGEESR